MVSYDREDLVSGRIRWADLTPPDWRDRNNARLEQQKSSGRFEAFEKEYTRKDGSRVPVLIGGATFEEGGNQGVAYVLDLTERKRVEAEARENEQRYREAQLELAHANRVVTMGKLTASIAHEVNQPLTSVVANAEACLGWLRRRTPDLDAACRSVEWIIADGNRASEVILRVRALANKTSLEKVPLDVNDVVRETIPLVQRELISHQVLLRMELAPTLPMILGDRVQLQQVIINLVMNGIESMQSFTDRPRELVVRSRQDETQQVLVSVADCGVGISAENADRLFTAFFTTKSSGMGMGLSICRSIIDAHGGRLWATTCEPRGALFQFTIPAD
jgi:C4-dicarboxylate-specific signal transduction histidine kinase